jgi:CRISPR-associated protein Cmr4
VTCPDALRDWCSNKCDVADGDVSIATGVGVGVGGKLNLGWLMLSVAEKDFSLIGLDDVEGEIRNRAVLVSNKLFGTIVNDNLEVRTSVSIDPATGAAAPSALFTYEALPRTTVLAFEVIVKDPEYFQVTDGRGDRKKPLQNNGRKATVLGTVKSGLRLFEALGVGGMNTRGMGRLRVLNLEGGSKAQSPPAPLTDTETAEVKR